jgi:UDP-glucose 4-epimerase
MRALITGGTGFVGANLVRRLLRDGHEVHLLVRRDHAGWRIEDVRADVRLHEAELADRDGVEAAVRAARPDWVFHCATYGAYSPQADFDRMLATNVAGTANLVSASVRAGVAALVNSGSSSEYGLKDHPPTEDEALDPNSHYAITKAFGTHLCRHTARTTGVRMPTLRLYSVYGPYEEPTRLLPRLIVEGLAGRLPPLVDPDVARDFVHADDVCEAYVRAAERPSADPGAVYNVGTGLQTTIREIVEVSRRSLGVREEPAWGSMPNRRWDATTWVADPSKIRAELGWVPRVRIDDGFRAMAEWMRSDPIARRVYGVGSAPSA